MPLKRKIVTVTCVCLSIYSTAVISVHFSVVYIIYVCTMNWSPQSMMMKVRLRPHSNGAQTSEGGVTTGGRLIWHKIGEWKMESLLLSRSRSKDNDYTLLNVFASVDRDSLLVSYINYKIHRSSSTLAYTRHTGKVGIDL